MILVKHPIYSELNCLETERKGYWDFHRSIILTRYWLGLACKIPRKGFHLLDMKFISLIKCVLKHKKREKKMRNCPYASAVGSLIYAMLCTRPDVCYTVSIVSRYQSNPGSEHWIAVKYILKHYFLVFGGEDLTIQGYTDSDFQSDIDDRKSILDLCSLLAREQ